MRGPWAWVAWQLRSPGVRLGAPPPLPSSSHWVQRTINLIVSWVNSGPHKLITRRQMSGTQKYKQRRKKEGIFASGLKRPSISFIQRVCRVLAQASLSSEKGVHVKVRSGIAKTCAQAPGWCKGASLHGQKDNEIKQRSLTELVPWLKVWRARRYNQANRRDNSGSWNR